MKLSELLSLYKAQHSLYGECPSCGEVFRFSEIRTWHGAPPDDWLSAFKRLQAELEEARAGREPKRRGGKKKHSTFVRLT